MGIYDLGLCFLSHLAALLVFGNYKYGHAQKYALASPSILGPIHRGTPLWRYCTEIRRQGDVLPGIEFRNELNGSAGLG
jgi:hypothetical protein